jgi:threonine/homoserine/homoserine lactone efflux protein
MPTLPTILAFIPIVLVMQAVPGPDTLLVVSRGIGQGRRIAIWTAVGAVAAGFVQLPLLAAGVATLIRSSPAAFASLRYAGAAFLIYVGVRLIWGRTRQVQQLRRSPPVTSSRQAFWEGVVSNLANPNVLIFMIAFLPQFVDPSQGSVASQMLVLGAIQKATGLIVLGGTAVAAGQLGDWLARRHGWMVWQERFAGTVIMLLGIRLLTADPRPTR